MDGCVLSIEGTFRTKGRPPRWLPSFMRPWFTWDRRHPVSETLAFDLDAGDGTFPTEVGPFRIVATKSRLALTVAVFAGGAELWCRSIDLAGCLPYERGVAFDAAGFSGVGKVRVAALR